VERRRTGGEGEPSQLRQGHASGDRDNVSLRIRAVNLRGCWTVHPAIGGWRVACCRVRLEVFISRVSTYGA
jgi:hypothetical protein